MNAQIYAGLPPKQQHRALHGILIGHPKEIIEAVSLVLEVRYNDIIGATRLRTVVEARHIAIGLIAIANPEFTLKQIGKLFSNRHHATVIYSKENFADLYQYNAPFKNKVDQVKKITNIY